MSVLPKFLCSNPQVLGTSDPFNLKIEGLTKGLHNEASELGHLSDKAKHLSFHFAFNIDYTCHHQHTNIFFNKPHQHLTLFLAINLSFMCEDLKINLITC